MKQAVIALDPGITTGMAVLTDPDGYLVATTNWTQDNLGQSLDVLIRHLHLEGYTLHAVVEQMPRSGGRSEDALDQVRRTIHETLVEVYEVPTIYVAPGVWKPSRVARTAVLPKEWDEKRLTTHQKDAIKMGCYALEKKHAH